MEESFDMARALVGLQEDERRAIARELHDRLGQSLAVMQLLLGEALNSPPDKMRYTLGEAQSLVNEMMSLARDLSLELRPKMLDDLGLLPALLYLFESYTARTHVLVKFEHHGIHKNFPDDIGLAAYRIVKEALENVALHAGVKDVRVLAWSDRRLLSIRVIDKGKGFEAGKLSGIFPGGIRGMQGRAKIAGGKFNIAASPGEGTVVSAEFPLLSRSRRAGME